MLGGVSNAILVSPAIAMKICQHSRHRKDKAIQQITAYRIRILSSILRSRDYLLRTMNAVGMQILGSQAIHSRRIGRPECSVLYHAIPRRLRDVEKYRHIRGANADPDLDATFRGVSAATWTTWLGRDM